MDRDGAFADNIVMPSSTSCGSTGFHSSSGLPLDPGGNAVPRIREGTHVPVSTVFVLGCRPIGCFEVCVAPRREPPSAARAT